MLANAYGTPYWSTRKGQPMGKLYRLAGLGADTTVLDPSVFNDPSGDILTNPSGYPSASYPPVSSAPPAWLQSMQLGVSDAFQFAKLFNPVPPGTVMQTGPNGTYIARAANGQTTPGYFPSVGAAGFSWGTMLLIGGVVLVAAVATRGRG